MFADANSQIGLWATLSAPFCATFAAASANNAVGAPVPGYGLLLWPCICVVTFTVAVASWAGEGLSALILASGLAYLAVFDARILAVPVWPVLALTVLGLLAPAPEGALSRFVSAAIGWGAFTALSFSYRKLRGRDGLGEGDALVAALLGAWLSLEGLAWSVALGGLIGVAFVLAAGGARAPMPLVPALAVGACLHIIVRSIVA